MIFCSWTLFTFVSHMYLTDIETGKMSGCTCQDLNSGESVQVHLENTENHRLDHQAAGNLIKVHRLLVFHLSRCDGHPSLEWTCGVNVWHQY